MVKIHGNYCGPNWTAGLARPASDIKKLPYVAPTDALDAACREHDLACSEGGCSSKADNRLRNSALLIALTQPRLREVALLVAAGMTVTAPTRKR